MTSVLAYRTLMLVLLARIRSTLGSSSSKKFNDFKN